MEQTQEDKENVQEMHLLDHLRELRRRLIYAALAVAVTSLAAYSYAGQVFHLLSAPLHRVFPADSLIGTGPAEAFMLKLKAAVLTGIILALPLLFYQLWAFIAPGLYRHERRLLIPFVTATTGLFLLGAAFCYYAVFPVAFIFFRDQYASIGVTPQIRLSEHLSFVINGIVAFGAVFEIPVLAYLLASFGILSHRDLLRWWRHAIIVIFIVAAVLTPPDVISQLMMAAPLLVLYAVSIFVAKLCYRERPAQDEQAAGGAANS